jgi:hypothetical protein
MAVSVPGRNSAVTLLTATWPPKRMVRPSVARTGCSAVHAGGPFACGGTAEGRIRPPHRRAAATDFSQRLLRIGTGSSDAGNLAHQFEQVPLAGLGLLDAEVVHRLHRLVILLAEGHLALRRVEVHAFHGGDELLGVAGAGLGQRRQRRAGGGEAAGGEEVRRRLRRFWFSATSQSFILFFGKA